MANKFEYGHERPKNYEYFVDGERREMIYQLSKELAEYLRREQIRRIIFVDAGARMAWVGLDEYWKKNFENQKRPDRYFINPEAFKGEGIVVVGDDELAELIEIENFFGESSNLEDIVSRNFPVPDATPDNFNRRYWKLAESKNEALAIFDTCIHTGKTMRPIVNILRKAGYSNVRVITAHSERNACDIKPDFSLDQRVDVSTCYPYGHQAGIRKGMNVSSEANSDKRDIFLAVKREIRRIIAEHT